MNKSHSHIKKRLLFYKVNAENMFAKGNLMNLREKKLNLTKRLTSTFLCKEAGKPKGC